MSHSGVPRTWPTLWRTAVVAAALLVPPALSGCGGDGSDGAREPGAPAHSSDPAPSTVSPTPSPPPGGVTLEELSQDPCSAIDAEAAAALGVAGEGQVELGNDGVERYCSWETSAGSVSLHLHPDSDETTRAETMRGVVRQVVVGEHEAVQVEFRSICYTFVAPGPGRSIEIIAIGSAQEGLCPVGRDFATEIVSGLR